jgi:hypothetical protein
MLVREALTILGPWARPCLITENHIFISTNRSAGLQELP